MSTVHAIVLSFSGQPLPVAVEGWLSEQRIPVVRVDRADELFARCAQARPRLLLIDARVQPSNAADVIRLLKSDAYTAVIPAVVVAGSTADAVGAAFDAGADEVVLDVCPVAEAVARLNASIRRSDRDVQVHPSTRLPGAAAIDAEIGRRMAGGVQFATCYADLDFFKEFNDRYSYNHGDRVIMLTAQILHDVVRGRCGRSGFVGHIGGDDFIFIVPPEDAVVVCGEIIDVFDTLISWQYSDEDRRAGYFLGNDRRGHLHRVSLMTISIGVVTTERRRFTHAAQVSALATEMKNYAKTLPGSVFSIDRRQDDSVERPRPSGPIRLLDPERLEGGAE